MNKEIIIALDFAEIREVKEFLLPFKGESLYVKIGMELFYQSGPALLHYLKENGHRIFLDLKLHDIPNTVKQAMKGLSRLGVDMVNVHAAGGITMMEAAIDGLNAGATNNRPICIAVTQLTSTSEEVLREQILIPEKMETVVCKYAEFAKIAGLDGVVSSALEVPAIKNRCGEQFLTITPGIRMLGDDVGDQKRVVTPKKARELGSDFIVVGRSITKASDPYAAYSRVKVEWEGK